MLCSKAEPLFPASGKWEREGGRSQPLFLAASVGSVSVGEKADQTDVMMTENSWGQIELGNLCIYTLFLSSSATSDVCNRLLSGCFGAAVVSFKSSNWRTCAAFVRGRLGIFY